MKNLNLKFLIHFHHGIIGLIVVVISTFYNFPLLFNIGLSLVISDAIHHLIVLWIILGNPEFHIIYKNVKYYKKESKSEDKKIKKFIRHLIHHS